MKRLDEIHRKGTSVDLTITLNDKMANNIRTLHTISIFSVRCRVSFDGCS